jgi:predicted PurR-regulated permease PerM
MNQSPLLRTLLLILVAGILMVVAKPLLIPLAYALIIAMVLYPITRWLEMRKFGRTLSILLPLLIVVILFVGLLGILSYETIVLINEWHQLQPRIEPAMTTLHEQIESIMGWTQEEQQVWLKQLLSKGGTEAVTMLRGMLIATGEALVDLIIIPIYVALILNYRRRLVNFLSEIVPEQFRTTLSMALADTLQTFSQFIRGMAVVYLSVGALNSIGLWILGVENPLLYGMITAIMTIIPYFGIVISALLPITVSWLSTGSLAQPIGIISVFAVVQYLEAYLIFPWVVGRHVNLNTLAALIAIFTGALIWGVAGMILFVPFLAVFRIFASHYPGMKPWARVMEG